jgi:hypothetical protein
MKLTPITRCGRRTARTKRVVEARRTKRVVSVPRDLAVGSGRTATDCMEVA